MEFHKIVAKNIYLYRKKNKISLDKLSKLTGVSTSSLNEIEKGNTIPSINTVWKISNGLKLSFSSLMNEAESDYTQLKKKMLYLLLKMKGNIVFIHIFHLKRVSPLNSFMSSLIQEQH